MKSDLQLQNDVMNELKWEPSVNAARIGVSAKQGVVTLSGHIESFAEQHAAEKAAKRVKGVTAIANELEVKLPGSSKLSDEEIATNVLNTFKASVVVPDENIKVTVDSGWVTLEGDVEWQYQKTAAANAVRYLKGVVGVSNNIAVKPHVSAQDVKDKIIEALKRYAEEDAKRISVEVKENKVILRGMVHSTAEREQAENSAWAAPGVSVVEDYIKVEV